MFIKAKTITNFNGRVYLYKKDVRERTISIRDEENGTWVVWVRDERGQTSSSKMSVVPTHDLIRWIRHHQSAAIRAGFIPQHVQVFEKEPVAQVIELPNPGLVQ